MTALDQFDPFEQRISAAIEEIAAPARPDYLADVFSVTARTSQRPRWSFLERWLHLDTALGPVAVRRMPLRPLLLLALLLLLAAALTAVYVGAQRRVPAPFGPANNGRIAYPSNGDLYVRDSLADQGRLLVGGDGKQTAPTWSPDGQWLSFVTTTNAGDLFTVVRADGSGARQLMTIPPTGNAQAAWRPDSRAIAIIRDVSGAPRMSISYVDGTPTRDVALGDLSPLDVSWRPPGGATILVRAKDPAGVVDLYAIRPDGTGLHGFGLPGTSSFGSTYTLSGSSWSPDGSTIAYNSIELDPTTFITHFRTRLIAGDGSNGRALPGPTDPAVQEGWPTYSPDGRRIIVHRWTFKSDTDPGAGWLAAMPVDGSAPARDIGPRIPGGEDTGLVKTWSPDGSRILMSTDNTKQVFSIDPITGSYEEIPWTSELPDWQRVAGP